MNRGAFGLLLAALVLWAAGCGGDANIENGKAATKAGDFDLAVAHFSAAIVGDATNAEAYARRAFAYAELGKTDLAIQDATEAIRLAPDSPLARGSRGCAYIKAKRYGEAIEDFSKAIELDPSYAPAVVDRARAWALSREYDQSIADLVKAKSLNDPRVDQSHVDSLLAISYQQRGNERLKQGLYEESIADFTESLSLNPKDDGGVPGYTHYLCAKAFGSKGDKDKAREYHEKAVAINPQLSELPKRFVE